MADRLVARKVAGWTVVVGLAVAGMAWSATAVEGLRTAGAKAIWGSLFRVPGLVLPLAPLAVALGAALAAARMESCGEGTALEAAGLGPLRTGRAVLTVGLLAGAAQWLVLAQGVYRAEVLANRWLPHDPPAWVWTGRGAVRTDGLEVEVFGGRITRVRRLPASAMDTPAIERDRMLQEPRTATAAALSTSPLLSARVERQVRLSRIAACPGLALFAWLLAAGRSMGWVGGVLALALSWEAVAVALQALASQGAISVISGAWLPPALAWVLVAVTASRR